MGERVSQVEKLERKVAALQERVSGLQLEIAGFNQRVEDMAAAVQRVIIWSGYPGKKP